MAWKTIDRTAAAADDGNSPLLSDAVREKIRTFFPRYPTRRAVLLPALHIVQETYGYVSHRAMRDVAELLGISPAEVLDTISFYTHFSQHPRGRKTIVLCRGLSCELMGASQVTRAVTGHLGLGEHETSADDEYTFVTEECLGVCEHGPCLLINERLHGRVRPDDVAHLLDDPANDRLGIERSTLYDGVVAGAAAIDSNSVSEASNDGHD